MRTANWLTALALFLCAAGARGGDGQIDILPLGGDQSFTISESGSYVLSGDVVITDPNVSCILIDADDVTIDLNGHVLKGPETVGTGRGIETLGARTGIRIFNGTLSGFGSNGLALEGGESILRDLTVIDNQDTGVRVLVHSIVEDCVSSNNGGIGIGLLGGLVRNCVAGQNSFGGIYVEDALVSRCNVNENSTTGGTGAAMGSSASLIIDNTVRDNNRMGIFLFSTFGSLLRGNSCIQNGNGGVDITGAGILVTGPAAANVIIDNSSNGNARGIDVNDVPSNNNLVVRNSAIANTNANYIFMGTNLFGPQSTNPSTATNPWSNFRN